MRKLIMKMNISLDGFVTGPETEKDWIFKTGDQESVAWSVGDIAQAGLIIMGRKSFENMSPFWPTATSPFAEPMNTIPKAVFTKKGYSGIPPKEGQTSAEASWVNTKVIHGDLAEEIGRLKAEPGKPIVALGGAGFMHNLIATGLIDEYHLAIHPVVFGSGLPIFTGLTSPFYLKLAEVKSFPGGIVVHIYMK
jgi:dihydrofolate reductase